MQDDPVREYVVRRIAGGIDPKDIVLEVCQRQGLGWQEAEAWVAEISHTVVGEVARRRFPLFAFLALGIIIAGLVLIVSFIRVLLAAFVAASTGGTPSGMVEAGGLIGWLLLNLEFLGEVIVGVAMVAGGAVGLHRVMRETLEM